MRIENFIQTITTFEFKIYDKHIEQGFEYDSTIEQCLHRVWKKFPSAVFTKMTVFHIVKESVNHIDLKVIKSTRNPYALGHDEDMNERTLKKIQDLKKN